MKNQNEIESFIQDFSRKPPPQGLREKVLQSAYQERMASRVMTSGLWILLIGCVVLACFSFFLDIKISINQQKRISSLIEMPQASDISKEKIEVYVIAELINGRTDSKFVSWMERHYGMKKKTKKTPLDYKFKVLMEEFNGN